MKLIVAFSTILLLLNLKTFSQENKMNSYQSGLELVQTEYAFAELTKNTTVRNGFAHYIADDGILFRPNPVNGLEFLEHSADQPGILLWYPTASFISSGGDLGVNTGPWEFKKSLDEESVAFGQFLTVWEKQPDGNWEFLIDLGITHPKPEEIEEGIENSVVIDKPEGTKDYNDILKIEKCFNSSSLNKNYKLIVNNETTFLRNNRKPIKNKENDEFLSQLAGSAKWETLGGKSSEANNLAYTYGKGTALDNEMNSVYEFYYIHVWINDDGSWNLLYDVVSEIQQQE